MKVLLLPRSILAARPSRVGHSPTEFTHAFRPLSPGTSSRIDLHRPSAIPPGYRRSSLRRYSPAWRRPGVRRTDFVQRSTLKCVWTGIVRTEEGQILSRLPTTRSKSNSVRLHKRMDREKSTYVYHKFRWRKQQPWAVGHRLHLRAQRSYSELPLTKFWCRHMEILPFTLAPP